MIHPAEIKLGVLNEYDKIEQRDNLYIVICILLTRKENYIMLCCILMFFLLLFDYQVKAWKSILCMLVS